MILALSTVLHTHEMALIDGESILAERSWPDERDDLDRLLPMLQEMLEELGLTKEAITEILVVNGPGPFTAIRTGVTCANALAEGLKVPLYSMDTFELLERKVASTEPVIVVLHAGGLDVAVRFKGKMQVGPLSTLLAPISHGSQKIVTELRETQMDELRPIILEKGWQMIQGHELLSLGEVVLTYELKGLESQNAVDAIYLKDPVITRSSDKWKR